MKNAIEQAVIRRLKPQFEQEVHDYKMKLRAQFKKEIKEEKQRLWALVLQTQHSNRNQRTKSAQYLLAVCDALIGENNGNRI